LRVSAEADFIKGVIFNTLLLGEIMINLYYQFMSLFDHIPIEITLFLVIFVLPFLILMLDDLIFRGYTGLKRGKL